MVRRPRPEEVEASGFLMTPMIDIVFQLIIFFMLVLDLERRQFEPVHLPDITQNGGCGVPETVTLNVLKDGTVRIHGRTYWRPPDGDNNDALIGFFQVRAGMERYGNGRYPVHIRADRSTEFQHLQKILMIVTRFGGVTRVEFAGKMKGERP